MKPARLGLLPRLLGYCVALLAGGLQSSAVVFADEGAELSVQLPASVRYQADASDESPDFQRHVVPLLGRLGCNGRNCHGSFQGRGGFRLSLFGYDFEMDHAAMTAAASSTDSARVSRSSPVDSLILQKPTLEVDHEGGQRLEVDSWEYRLLQRWIAAGGEGAPQPAELESLTIEPAELLFEREGDQVALRVIAHWSDGQTEDVTPLCRFRTNNDSVATVDRDGVVTATGPGDSHVVAFYDNGIASIEVMLAYPADGFHHVDVSETESTIDRFVVEKLNKLRIEPSALCSDTEFLRRVSLDLTGTLPTSQEIRDFIADTAVDKREQKIDELLERPSYAAWWANKLCDFTGCNPQQQSELGQELSVQWYMWIFTRLRENVPYDELVRRIVLARGRETGESFDEYCQTMSGYFRADSPIDFSQRATMPHYWTRRSMDEPAKAAEAFAQNFLGIRLQCAQCHKHPFAAWTQTDYRDFSRLFEQVTYGVRSEDLPKYRELAGKVGMNAGDENGAAIRNDAIRRLAKGDVYPWRELFISERSEPLTVSMLRGGEVVLEGSQDPRQPLMEWMESEDHPWFARAFVNRVWASYFHKGIIEPTDDLNPANPPSHPQLLEWLTERFIAEGYDMRWLHREIVSSQTYQRSWVPSRNNERDLTNFSRMIPRRMAAEIVYDGVKQAVAATSAADEVRTDLTRRGTGHLSMRLAGTYAMRAFGKPERAVNCDCERNNQPTLLQAVFLQNDPIIEQRLEESGWLAELRDAQAKGELPAAELLVEEAWLRTVGRLPDESQRERALEHLRGADNVSEGMSDLLWALLNTKEFLLIK